MSFCPLPFRHVFIEPRGVKPCCSYTQMFQGSVEDWLSSQELNDLQRSMLDGQIAQGCASCIADEQRDGTSTRLGAIAVYGAEHIRATQIDYVDYRANNICNFRCRSCEPFYSNGIAFEVKRHVELQPFFSVPDTKLARTLQQDKQWIIDNVNSIKRLMFTGGEPTLIPEVREIIEYIREKNLTDISIMITSNASFTDPYWFEITQSMPNIHWTLSLDSVGTAAEVIRHGTDWAVVSNNIERMFDIAPSVNVGTVVTNLSVLQLDLLFAFVNNLKEKYSHRANGRTQFIEICNWPRYLSPYNWPEDRRGEVVDYLKNILANQPLQDKQRHIVETLAKDIESNNADPQLWAEFEHYNKTLDNIRRESYQQLLELH